MLELEIQSPKPETRVPNPKTKIVGIVVCCVDHISVLLVCRPTSSYEVCASLVQKTFWKGIKQMQCLLLLESFVFRALENWDKNSANMCNQKTV